MDNNFLLTFFTNKANINQFCWFESEEEMIEFISNNKNKIEVIEAVEILASRSVEM